MSYLVANPKTGFLVTRLISGRYLVANAVYSNKNSRAHAPPISGRIVGLYSADNADLWWSHLSIMYADFLVI